LLYRPASWPLADGMTAPEIIAAFPFLEQDDIADALRYAATVRPLP